MFVINEYSVPKRDESPEIKGKSKVGLISRKTQTTSFIRRKNNEILLLDLITENKQISKEKCRSQINIMQKHRSFDAIKPMNYQQIKFLSPKNEGSQKIISLSQVGKCDRSPRFSRKSQIQAKKLMTSSVISKNEFNLNQDHFNPCISRISLESVNGKDAIIESQTPTCDDWATVARQNYRLKQEIKDLRGQIQQDRKKNSHLEQQINKLHLNNKKHSGVIGKCKNCCFLEQIINKHRKQINGLSLKISENQKQFQKFKNQIGYLKRQNEKINKKYRQLQEEYKSLTIKIVQQQNLKVQLSNIINTLNSKLGSTSEQLRYLSIQQNILLKKKQECQQTKAQSIKLINERQSLRKIVNQYKQKLDILRKINIKNKKVKQKKSQKQICSEDLFELSSEHSIDGPW